MDKKEEVIMDEIYRLIFKSDRNHGNRVTSVVVLKGTEKELKLGDGAFVTYATVTRSNSELDNKVLAQKYALTKALRGSHLSKKERRYVWSTFFMRSKRAMKMIGLTVDLTNWKNDSNCGQVELNLK